MRVVVIGGGQAGASLVLKLRQLGFEGEILLVSKENVPPYERPPLSKKHLLQDPPRAPVAILPSEFWDDHQVQLRLATTVAGIDPERNSIRIADETVPYDHLVLATGSSPRRLPGEITNGLDKVFHLRTLTDANELHAHLVPGKSIVFIGGGYIGMELAATARTLGLTVTVIERDDWILKRVASEELSSTIRCWHKEKGNSIVEGLGPVRLSGKGSIEAVHLTDGTEISADLVVVGTGATANTGLAAAARLKIDNGIAVDTFGRTSHSNIWAAGDCTSFRFEGRTIRLESVQNAIDQAEIVAENILGANRHYRPTPTFWSEQFDHLVQIAGLIEPGMDTVCRATSSGTSYWHYRKDCLKAVEVIDDPKTFAIARRLLTDGKSPPPGAIAAADRSLKAFLKSAKEFATA